MRRPSIFDVIILKPSFRQEFGGWVVFRADGTVLGGPFPTPVEAGVFRENEIRRLEKPGVATQADIDVTTSMDDVNDRDLGSFPGPINRS